MFRYALFSLFILTTSQLFAQEKPNVLMIVLDDLNDYVGVLGGHPQAKTPNIDRLASQGVLFTNAHANVPVCSPSRASFMTGISPLRSRMWGFSNWLKNDLLAQATTLPEFLKNKGYVTMQSGKVFHHSKKEAWSIMGIKKDYGPVAFNGKKATPHPLSPEGMHELGALDATFFSLADVPEVPPTDETPGAKGWYNGSWGGKPFRYVNETDRDLMTDEKSTIWAKKQMKKLEEENASHPFFMAIGLHRPHTPLVVPQKYFDLFPLQSIQVPVIKEDDIEDTFLEKNNLKNDGMSRGRKAYDGLIKGFTNDELALKKYTQAYLASVAFADDRVGELIETLEKSKFANNTIVILFSDHGYNLGEKKYLWKYNLWEETTRVPLIVKAPKYKGNSGKKVNHPVSLLDVYPTILSLTGYNVSSLMLNGKPQLDGFSLEPFLKNPKTKSWDGPDAALTIIASWRSQLPERQHLSVRGKRYRYIKYANGNEELYDHKKDPYEWNNLANATEYNTVKQKLSSILNQQLKIVK
jgi:arylsulfatase A-like enzyme